MYVKGEVKGTSGEGMRNGNTAGSCDDGKFTHFSF